MSEKVDPKALLDQLNDMLGRLRKIKSETKDEKITDKIDDCISDINLATNAIKQNSDGFELQYYQALAKSQKLITGISVKGSMLFFITIVVILFSNFCGAFLYKKYSRTLPEAVVPSSIHHNCGI